MKLIKNNLLILLLSMVGFLGCGVRGDPLPPLEPPTIGSGEPVQGTVKKIDPKKKNIDIDRAEEQKKSDE